MADWNPCEGTPTVNGSWNKRDDYKDSHSGPEICWDHSGQVEPLALTEMNDEEKDVSISHDSRSCTMLIMIASFSRRLLTPL